MEFENIRIDRGESIDWIVLNRPDRANAMSHAMLEEFSAALELLKGDGAPVIGIRGEGKGFCSGFDLGQVGKMGAVAVDPVADRARLQRNLDRWLAIWDHPKPVIAAVHGHALGGGIQIALGADIRIVHPDTQMAVREVHWGLVPDMTGTLVLSRLARPDVVKELVFTARVFSGKEAFELGLATRLSATPFDDAMAMAQEIADRSPDAIRGSKELLNRLFADGAAEQFAEERRVIGALIGKANQVEAVTANFEKRKTAFIDPA